MKPTHRIPTALLKSLESLPKDTPVLLLLRHAVRPRLPDDDAEMALSLTPRGSELARSLGGMLKGQLRSLWTSPVLRCKQTAEALHEGAGGTVKLIDDPILGGLGAFVTDSREAWRTFKARGHVAIMRHLINDGSALPGFSQADEATQKLLEHMFGKVKESGRTNGVHVFVTHDLFVAIAAARLLGVSLKQSDWPGMLDGALFWREGDQLHVHYRGLVNHRPWLPQGLTEELN